MDKRETDRTRTVRIGKRDNPAVRLYNWLTPKEKSDLLREVYSRIPSFSSLETIDSEKYSSR